MPRAFLSHKSGAHRLACLSLYRALLRQCSRLPTSSTAYPHSPPDVLKNLVRYRFRKDCDLYTQSQVVNGLNTASSVLDHLYASNAGSKTALVKVTKLLEEILSLAESTNEYRAKLAPPPGASVPKKFNAKVRSIRENATKARHERPPGVKKITERPLPLSEIKSGKRRVPYLVAAHGIPFLRYSSRQAVGLGRYIRQQRKIDASRWGKKDEMDGMVGFAEAEDEWDRMMERWFGVRDYGGGVGGGGSWARAFQEGAEGLMARIKARTKTRAAMGEKMWEVVLKERDLAWRERVEFRAKRRAEKKAQQKAEKAGSVAETDDGAVDITSPTHSGLTDNIVAA